MRTAWRRSWSKNTHVVLWERIFVIVSLSLTLCRVYRTFNQLRTSTTFPWFCFRGKKKSLMTVILRLIWNEKKVHFSTSLNSSHLGPSHTDAMEKVVLRAARSDRVPGYQTIRRPLSLEYLPTGFPQ